MPTKSSYSAPNLQMLIDAMLLQHFCLLATLTSDRGDIIYISRGMVLIVLAETFPLVSAKTEDRAADSAEHRLKMNAVTEELKQCRDELHLTRAEMQSSQEELRSANEELQTVNYELQGKVDALSQASDDMKNLLNSAHIATLFLDEGLKVRRFTNQTASIIKLIPGDAGRPITDLVTELQYPELADDVREVLHSLVFRECQVPARDGRWFNVRIMPYRTQDNRIDGVVITFFDISTSKALEETLRKTLAALQSRLAPQSEAPDRTQQLENLLAQAQTILEQGLASMSP